MGRISIGRVGHIDGLGNGIPLNAPDSGSWRGDSVTISGDFDPQVAGGKTQGLILRQQFQGLASVANRVLPWTFADTPELDGFYLTGMPQITSARNDPGFAHGSFGWQIEGDRVLTSSAPLIQSRVQGALRTQPDGTANAHTIAAGDLVAWHSPGVHASDVFTNVAGIYGYTAIDTTGSLQSRRGTDGIVVGYFGDDFLDDAPQWFTPPNAHYKGAANIAMQYQTGGSYYSVVGGHIQNRPHSWALGNTLMSALATSTSDQMEFLIVAWDSDTDSFTVLDTFRLLGGYEPQQVRVLQNTPAVCSIRVYCHALGTPAEWVVVDLRIRRGARYFEGLVRTPTALPHVLSTTSNQAATSLTGGIRRTSNDSSGNRWIMASPQGITKDTTNGDITLSSNATRFAFMVGAEMGGSGAVSTNQAQSLIYQYMAAQTEQQRVVVS